MLLLSCSHSIWSFTFLLQHAVFGPSSTQQTLTCFQKPNNERSIDVLTDFIFDFPLSRQVSFAEDISLDIFVRPLSLSSCVSRVFIGHNISLDFETNSLHYETGFHNFETKRVGLGKSQHFETSSLNYETSSQHFETDCIKKCWEVVGDATKRERGGASPTINQSERRDVVASDADRHVIVDILGNRGVDVKCEDAATRIDKCFWCGEERLVRLDLHKALLERDTQCADGKIWQRVQCLPCYHPPHAHFSVHLCLRLISALSCHLKCEIRRVEHRAPILGRVWTVVPKIREARVRFRSIYCQRLLPPDPTFCPTIFQLQRIRLFHNGPLMFLQRWNQVVINMMVFIETVKSKRISCEQNAALSFGCEW